MPFWRSLPLLLMTMPASAGCGMALATGANTLGVFRGTSTYSHETADGRYVVGPETGTTEVLYSRRLRSGEVWELHLDVPVVLAPHMRTASRNPAWPESYSFYAVTPEVSMKTRSRFSGSWGIGGGFARFQEGNQLGSGAKNHTPLAATGVVLGYRFGLEFQLTPLMSLGLSAAIVGPQGRRFTTRPEPESHRVYPVRVGLGALLHF